MANEDLIRQLIGKGNGGMISAPADRMGEAMNLYEQAGKQSAECYMRNLRGECANPNLTGEYGAMSWREYDAIKASGQDPEDVSWRNSQARQRRAQQRFDESGARSSYDPHMQNRRT